MKRIESFKVDHDLLVPGLYISRTDGDVITYDIRTRKPNCDCYMSNEAMHTVEHIFATYARNSEYGENIIYFGPMGCRTGFYFLVRDKVAKTNVIKLVNDAFKYISDFEGDIPGAKKKECGNWREHNLSAAKKEAEVMLKILADWTEADLDNCIGGKREC